MSRRRLTSKPPGHLPTKRPTEPWHRQLPLWAYTQGGMLLGVLGTRGASAEPLLGAVHELASGIAGAAVAYLLLEMQGQPPTDANRRRRRITHTLVGLAVGYGALNVWTILERVTTGVLGG